MLTTSMHLKFLIQKQMNFLDKHIFRKEDNGISFSKYITNTISQIKITNAQNIYLSFEKFLILILKSNFYCKIWLDLPDLLIQNPDFKKDRSFGQKSKKNLSLASMFLVIGFFTDISRKNKKTRSWCHQSIAQVFVLRGARYLVWCII